MKLKIDGYLMSGDYTEKAIDEMEREMNKSKNKRSYIYGIDFSSVDIVEVKQNEKENRI